MRYLLDTNILLFYLRQSSIITHIDSQYQPFDAHNDAIISIISVGELRAIAKISKWGEKRIDNMNLLLEKITL
jgi:predicted nucleic acid-binding protein